MQYVLLIYIKYLCHHLHHAICAVDLHKVPLSSSTPCNIAVHAVYKAFTDVIILDEVMRQKPSQIKLLNRLNHIRIGKVDQKDCNEINDRAFNNLHDNEKKKFNKETQILYCSLKPGMKQTNIIMIFLPPLMYQ